jgi:hypothetical protein
VYVDMISSSKPCISPLLMTVYFALRLLFCDRRFDVLCPKVIQSYIPCRTGEADLISPSGRLDEFPL